MNIRKFLCIGVGLLSFAASPIGAAQESAPDIDVRIAKTARFVRLFGDVEPALRGKVVVRLLRRAESGGSFVLLHKERVPLENASYSVRFARPKRGGCLAKVKLVGSDAATAVEFPCYIPDFPSGSAVLTSATSGATEIDALIADTDPLRQYGLMYRPRLRHDLGMAFLWPEDTQGGFWMKNTLIPLSIAFFDSNNVIVEILDMEPCVEDDCTVYDPGVSYRGALEVNQGAFREWGISKGDLIEVTKTEP